MPLPHELEISPDDTPEARAQKLRAARFAISRAASADRQNQPVNSKGAGGSTRANLWRSAHKRLAARRAQEAPAADQGQADAGRSTSESQSAKLRAARKRGIRRRRE